MVVSDASLVLSGFIAPQAKAREQGLWNLWVPADMAQKIDYLCDMVPESERHLLVGR